ncbi:MAG: SIS domain-containing protein [Sedimentisphaerales bacterium]|nr:SIS domain-containing protein [Sedimentisphaerales bacterium]
MSRSSAEIVAKTLAAHEQLLNQFRQNNAETIAGAAEMITDALKNGGTVYICGNGGSAADAQHIAAELVGRFTRERRALPAIALSTDTSILTSIANDYAYEKVFARQVEALVKAGDVLWAFSTSGASANVIGAAKLAREKGASLLAFTGRPDTALERLADICICAGSESTARSQEIHQLAYHVICDLVEMSFADS